MAKRYRRDRGTPQTSLETDGLVFKQRNGVDRIVVSDLVRFGTKPTGDRKNALSRDKTVTPVRRGDYPVPVQHVNMRLWHIHAFLY